MLRSWFHASTLDHDRYVSERIGSQYLDQFVEATSVATRFLLRRITKQENDEYDMNVWESMYGICLHKTVEKIHSSIFTRFFSWEITWS